MKNHKTLLVLLIVLALAAGCSQAPPPETAEEILSRSVDAHGGKALTDWNNMSVRGKVLYNDISVYNADYLLDAEKPDKLRFEYDLTADKGRQFMIYFMNGELAWSQRNLLPSGHNPRLMNDIKRKMQQCNGIAYYAENSDKLIWEEDADVEFKEEETIIKTVPCYVVTSIIAQDTTKLFIDKEKYYFTQEQYPRVVRQFTDFKKFGSATLPSKIVENLESRYGTQVRPFTINEIKFNITMPEETFTEDMPEKQ